MKVQMISVALLLAAAGAAQATLVTETAQLAGMHRYNLATGDTTEVYSAGRSVADRGVPASVLYSNLTAPAVAGNAFSQVGTTTTFGDRVTLTGTGGALQDFACTLFNSPTSNTTSITTGTMNINFFRAVDGSPLGGFSVPLAPFIGAGLAPGFFSLISVTGISLATNIQFDTTDVLITQTLSGANGGRNGVVFFNPIAVGNSVPQMFLQGGTANLAAGMYNIGTAPNFLAANPGFFVSIPSPAAASLLGLGGLVALRRRR